MNEKKKAKIILKTLNKIYPKTPIPLKSKNTLIEKLRVDFKLSI